MNLVDKPVGKCRITCVYSAFISTVFGKSLILQAFYIEPVLQKYGQYSTIKTMSTAENHHGLITPTELHLDQVSPEQKKSIANVTTLQSFEAALRMAYFDHLTGIHNRDGVDAYLNLAFDKGLQLRSVGAIDFNGFKQINSNHSLEGGDQVLSQFAERANAHLQKISEDTGVIFSIARWGGDEFAIIVLTQNGIQMADEEISQLVKKALDAAQKDPAKALINGEHRLIPFSVALGLSHGAPYLANFNSGLSEANRNLDDIKSGRESFLKAMELDFVKEYFAPLLKDANGTQVRIRLNRGADIPLIDWIFENDADLNDLFNRIEDHIEVNPDCGIDLNAIKHYLYPAIRPGHRALDVVDIGTGLAK